MKDLSLRSSNEARLEEYLSFSWTYCLFNDTLNSSVRVTSNVRMVSEERNRKNIEENGVLLM
jgi:hypothetical protein